MKALVDGDEAIFKAAVIQVDDVDWESDEGGAVSRAPTLKEAKQALKRLIDSWTEAAECDECVVVLSPRDRKLFRRGLYPAYKGERGSKPDHFWELDDWLRRSFETQDYPGLEADDTMGIMSGPGRVIVSSDKDMKTVPGPLYNPGKRTKGVISPTRADWQWMYQTLMGDSTDGFGGCIGIGPKKAEGILENATTLKGWFPLVRETFRAPKTGKYKAVTQTTADAVLMAQLARILRPGEYDPDTGQVSYDFGPLPITFNAHALAR